MRYVELADTLRERIAGGVRGALPSEAELGREYGVSRVTVRRALELLRDEGLVSARRGVGWFVAVDPVRQSLGRVTTIEAALEAAGAPDEDAEKRLVARDPRNVPLFSAFDWSGEAVERILRVPSGFMRDRTQDRVEELAAAADRSKVDLALVEQAVAIGRELMEEMIRREAEAKAAAADGARKADVAPAQRTGERLEEHRPALNEVGSPSALQARRAGIAEAAGESGHGARRDA
jgi:DNA-binding transcriptional MocR family regulator